MSVALSVEEVQTFLSLIPEERIQRELNAVTWNENVFQESCTVAEIAQCAATSEYMQIEKAPARNALQMLTTTKYILFAARFFFGCVVSICSMCVVKLTKVFS